MNTLAFKNIAEIAAWQILQKLIIHQHLKHALIFQSIFWWANCLWCWRGKGAPPVSEFDDINLVCFQANGGIERAVLDAYCWMYSSWNIPQEYKGACTGGDQVMRVEGGRGGRGGLLIINTFLLTRCITAYVPSTIETILYYTFCAFFVNIKRQRFAFAQDRRWQYTKLLLSLLFT